MRRMRHTVSLDVDNQMESNISFCGFEWREKLNTWKSGVLVSHCFVTGEADDKLAIILPPCSFFHFFICRVFVVAY